MPLPNYDKNGNLPPGIYNISIAEFRNVFGYNRRRIALIQGLLKGMDHLSQHGCQKIYVNGSFITEKEFPNDFDSCWDDSDLSNEQLAQLKQHHPEFFMLRYPRREQKDIYLGEFWPASTKVEKGLTVLELFQVDRVGNSKGIILLNP